MHFSEIENLWSAVADVVVGVDVEKYTKGMTHKNDDHFNLIYFIVLNDDCART